MRKFDEVRRIMKEFYHIFQDFGIMDLLATEPFRSKPQNLFSDLRTFGLNNLLTNEPSNLRGVTEFINAELSGARWLSGYSAGLTIEWSRVRIPLRPFGNFGNFIYPTLPVSFGRDTKIRWSLLSGVYARGSQLSHKGGECVTCSDGTKWFC